jgi:hypothetical protein
MLIGIIFASGTLFMGLAIGNILNGNSVGWTWGILAVLLILFSGWLADNAPNSPRRLAQTKGTSSRNIRNNYKDSNDAGKTRVVARKKVHKVTVKP